MEKMLLNVEEMAQVLGIGRSKAYELVHSAGFPMIRIGRTMRIPKAQLEIWIKNETGREVMNEYN